MNDGTATIDESNNLRSWRQNNLRSCACWSGAAPCALGPPRFGLLDSHLDPHAPPTYAHRSLHDQNGATRVKPNCYQRNRGSCPGGGKLELHASARALLCATQSTIRSRTPGGFKLTGRKTTGGKTLKQAGHIGGRLSKGWSEELVSGSVVVVVRGRSLCKRECSARAIPSQEKLETANGAAVACFTDAWNGSNVKPSQSNRLEPFRSCAACSWAESQGVNAAH
jgi:hypothetical protein